MELYLGGEAGYERFVTVEPDDKETFVPAAAGRITGPPFDQLSKEIISMLTAMQEQITALHEEIKALKAEPKRPDPSIFGPTLS